MVIHSHLKWQVVRIADKRAVRSGWLPCAVGFQKFAALRPPSVTAFTLVKRGHRCR